MAKKHIHRWVCDSVQADVAVLAEALMLRRLS